MKKCSSTGLRQVIEGGEGLIVDGTFVDLSIE